jgi:hypothetical protein
MTFAGGQRGGIRGAGLWAGGPGSGRGPGGQGDRKKFIRKSAKVLDQSTFIDKCVVFLVQHFCLGQLRWQQRCSGGAVELAAVQEVQPSRTGCCQAGRKLSVTGRLPCALPGQSWHFSTMDHVSQGGPGAQRPDLDMRQIGPRCNLGLPEVQHRTVRRRAGSWGVQQQLSDGSSRIILSLSGDWVLASPPFRPSSAAQPEPS